MTEELPEIFLENREDLTNYLKATDYEYVILKFTANWCNPCKKLDPFLENLISEKEVQFNNNKKKFLYIKVDVDECFDLYSFLKARKMINGIPAIFLYSKKIYLQNDEDKMYIPQASISGTNENEIKKVLSFIK